MLKHKEALFLNKYHSSLKYLGEILKGLCVAYIYSNVYHSDKVKSLSTPPNTSIASSDDIRKSLYIGEIVLLMKTDSDVILDSLALQNISLFLHFQLIF